MFRTSAILQLILGNIGRPGGGIMALLGVAFSYAIEWRQAEVS